MKRVFFFFVSAIVLTFCSSACQKAPFLTLTGPNSFAFTNAGGSQTITFSANRDWRITSSESWCKVSPSSGSASDDEITVSLNCSENLTYDPRDCSVIITMEDLSQTILVSQETNYGLFVSPSSFDISNEAQSIEVEVEGNVDYTISVDSGTPAWISRSSTKALSTDKLLFNIAENSSYDNREGTITIKQSGGDLSQVITVRQRQKDAIIVSAKTFNLSYELQPVLVEVDHNVSFSIIIPDDATDWISDITGSTKGLESDKIKFLVQENDSYVPRSATVTLKQTDGELSIPLTFNQKGKVAVSSVKLNKTELTLSKGESYSLTATVKPDNATDKTVTWYSVNSSIADVDDNGKVTAINPGMVDIVAMAGEKYANCQVTVIIPVTGISLYPKALVLEEGSSAYIEASVQPSDATEQGIVWKSSKSSVAVVSDGVVNAISPGSATITATTVDGNYSASCSVTVEKQQTKATRISLQGNALFVGPSRSYSLTAEIEPSDAVCDLSWSSNSGAVSVSYDGAFATISSNYATFGSTQIEVRDSRTGLSAAISVYSFVTNFTWAETTQDSYASFPLITLFPGEKHQLKYNSDAGSNVLNLFGNLEDIVLYESTDAISLSSDGVVTGIKNGLVGIKPTGYIQGSGNRLYIKVTDTLYEKEYNDTQDNANTVPAGIPMIFSLDYTGDVDWFKLTSNVMEGSFTAKISITLSGTESFSENEVRLCKYALYDYNMQLWRSGTFTFSRAEPSISMSKSLPAGPLYLKLYFDTSHSSALLPTEQMTLRFSAN